ncbi:MAG TPA: T9SS type A sorting domain-containing protein, partial [Chitinophagaceae bacterium]|nr:T9SS type A sorting domain-containing protein [Chitinophagaceae bacterium]
LSKNTLSFTAGLNSKKTVDLKWQLVSSSALLLSEVQRSINSQQWEVVATINAYGTGNDHSYNTTDHTPLNGLSYYRVKLVFKDGTIQYTDIKTVTITDGMNSLHVALNPAQEYTLLKLSSSTATVFTIDMMDNSGRVVMRKSISVNPGDNFVHINNLDRFPPGLYYIQATSANFNAMEKIIIQRE